VDLFSACKNLSREGRALAKSVMNVMAIVKVMNGELAVPMTWQLYLSDVLSNSALVALNAVNIEN
jgi:hypothetical protein